MRKTISMITLILLVGLTSCDNQTKVSSEDVISDSPDTSLTSKDMNSFISIFEIPAKDISRAIDFYQIILDLEIEKMEMEGMKMGVFPYEDQLVSAVLVEAEGYIPSAEGVTIYLNGGDDLQVVLDKVENNGGEIIVPKMPHADESGYFALFLDSEGNKMGLHSPNQEKKTAIDKTRQEYNELKEQILTEAMNVKIEYKFSARMWKHDSPGGWHFVSLPKSISKEIKENLGWQEEGWGRMKASAEISQLKWETAIWFDTKMETYILPIKGEVRKKRSLEIDEEIEVSVWI